jgi:hypothetical protein
MKKNDNGIGELLDLLKTHPEFIRDLVFDSTRIKRFLKGRAARRLAGGVDPTDPATVFLKCIASTDGGDAIGRCYSATQYLCAKGTRCELCYGGTQPA